MMENPVATDPCTYLLCYHARLRLRILNKGESMNRLLKLLPLTLVLSVLANSLIASSGNPSLTVGLMPRAVPQSASTINMPGLHNRVTIRRDERGIPHIDAANDDDLFFVQGYVTASDRLWQMDVQRRAVRGELSEIFGQGTLEQDKRRRTFGFAQIVDETAAHLPPDLSAILASYAKGVNAYIDSRTDKTLPPEFQILGYKPRPWKPADSLAVGKLMAEYLSTSWQLDIMRAALQSLPKDKRDALLPETSPLDVLVVGKDRKTVRTTKADIPAAPSAEVIAAITEAIEKDRETSEQLGILDQTPKFQASNNWVVSGKRTLSGKPLLANDPHIPASAPSVWYLTELSAPGMHVAGATFPGAPGIIVGHNDRIAWGVTNLGPDVQDVYIEKFDKDNPGRYLTPKGWLDAEVRHEQIKVRKGFGDTVTDTQTLDVTTTRHGPIILEKEFAAVCSAMDGA